MAFDKGREVEERIRAEKAADVAVAAAEDARAAVSPLVTFTAEDLARAISASLAAVVQGQSAHSEALIEAISDQAKQTAQAIQKTHRPENEVSPGISDYNPLGDRDHPRAELKCKVFLGPYPCERETMSVDEITMVNQLEPGEYQVKQKDGRFVSTQVVFERDDLGALRKLYIRPQLHTKEQWQNWPSLKSALRDILGLGAPDVAALEAELTRLRAQVATQAVGV